MSRKPGIHRQSGLSIVELMVAVTISLIMFAVIIELFASNKQAYRVQEGASELNENARYAVSHLQYFMRLADHWGGVQPNVVSIDGAVPTLATDCTGSPVISNVGFRGYNGSGATPPLDCIVAANYEPDTDAFFIRYAATHENARTVSDLTVPAPDSGVPMLPDAGAGEEPVLSAYLATANGAGIWVSTALGRRAVIFHNTDLGSIPSDVQFNDQEAKRGAGVYYRYESMLYYIRACSNPASGTSATQCDSGDDGVPTLVRMTLNPDLSFTEQDVVAGVENMQLLYGVDLDEDFVAERYDDAATVQANGDWDRVVTVRVSLMIANQQRDTTVNDTTTYYMLDDTWSPPADARMFRRSQYDFIVQIRNNTRA